jgi:hypothetical protein
VTVSFLRSVVCAMLVAAAGSAAAQDAPKFEFHGFVGGSVFSETGDGPLSSGGGAGAWVVTSAGAAAAPTAKFATDKGNIGGDVRQTRLNFALTGTQIFEGATPRAFAEIDFFGGNTAGAFGDVSIAPRLRVAFAELKLAKTGTMVRAGQDHDLILGIVLPQTVGHVAFPLSYQAGSLGWRRPGVGVYQTISVPGNMKLEIAASVGRSQWDATNTTVTGPASNLPAFQARLKLQAKIFEAFVAGHYNQTDITGVGVGGGNSSIDTRAVTAGGKVSYMGATLAGAGYMGRNLAPLAGNLLQVQPAAALALPGGPADIDEVGGWAQLGYNITPTISAWALAGFSNPDDEDLIKATLRRSRNVNASGMLRYQSKGYTAGVEYTMFRTSYTDRAEPLKANQLMLSGMYFF